jgi:preprotein translocase subunit SecF
MLLKRQLKFLSIFILAFILVKSVNAQEEELSKDLSAQYESLMKKSTSYQEYKVIKKVGLNQLWENVNDSLSLSSSNLYNAKTEISRLNAELAATKDSLNQRTEALDESNFGRDRISFIGMPLLKGTYNSIVWGIIFILTAIAIILFLRFAKSNSVTKNTKKDYLVLEEEFENYKKNTRENEINLKRDLQTAQNTIEDLKR